MTLSTGGAVSNTGLNLARLGVDTRLMGKVGDDLFGTAILDMVRRHGPELAEAMVVVPGETSSYTVVINPPHIDRIFLHCVGTNHTFGADDVRYDLVAEARVFHFGYPPLMPRFYADQGRELVEMFRRAQATGRDDLARHGDARPGRPERAGGLAGGDAPRDAPRAPLCAERRRVALYGRPGAVRPPVGDGGPGKDALAARQGRDPCLGRDGAGPGRAGGAAQAGRAGALSANRRGRGVGARRAQPIWMLWRDRELWQPAFRPDAVVGTTGAGDATIAGFLAALLRDVPPERALAIAAAVGACNVEAADALSGVRSWEETLARIDAGWHAHRMRCHTLEGVERWEWALGSDERHVDERANV